MSVELIPLQAKDIQILQDVWTEDARIDVVIPDKIDNPEDLWQTIETCCRIAGTASSVSAKIKPVVGRLLVVLKAYPDLYLQRGYESYEDFMCRGMKELFGISRTEAYACRRIAEKFPSLTVKEFREIGPTNLSFMASKVDEEHAFYKPMMEVAKSGGNLNDLRTKMAELSFSEKGEYEITIVSLRVPKTVAAQWKMFVESPAIQAYVQAHSGAAGEGLIFQCMIEECATEWAAQGQYILNAGRSENVAA